MIKVTLQSWLWDSKDLVRAGDHQNKSFRYLKFSVTSNYGSEAYVNGSEITMYGLDDI